MSPFVIAAAALVAAVAGYAFTHRGSTTLPPDLQTQFNQLLAQGTDPAKLEQVAVQLDALGFHQEAAKLRAKEALLGGTPPAPSPTPAQPSAPTPVAPQPAPVPVAPQPAPVQPAGPSLPAQFMKVTTSDPAPGGDLALRDQPSDSANVIGAAEKDSVTTVKNVSADGRFVQVEALNPAGRRASATGWGHAAFLVPTNPMKTSGRFDPITHRPYSGTGYHAPYVGASSVLCAGARQASGESSLCLQSCDVRQLPTYASGVVGHVQAGAVCKVLACVDERAGPGWCRVSCSGLSGWVPASALARGAA